MRRGRIEVITSFSNARIKDIRALDQRKGRREQGQFIAEGISVLLSARANGMAPRTVVVRAGARSEQRAVDDVVTWALDAGADVLEVSGAILEKIAAKDNPQSVLGVFPITYSAAPVPSALKSDETWIALEEIRDPGNLGTIIRTAHAAGVSGIILAGTCCDPHQRECARATMGSIFSVPLVPLSRGGLLDLMAAWPGATIATHIDGARDYRSLGASGPELIVMGREGPGLSEAVAAAATIRARIPMRTDIDSLNVAIATALVVYQVRANRLGA
jgi:RNA methyltransferase, TrmH family